MPFDPPATVLVTGAFGNLGQKLIRHLLGTPWCRRVIGVDRTVPGTAQNRVQAVAGDLTEANDPRWRAAIAEADAVVHLAAQNPAPNAPWPDAAASFGMTANLVTAASAARVRRFVFASSNHVMGQYKDPPLADTIGPGGLTTALPPAPGTNRREGEAIVRDQAYGGSKLMGERLCLGAATVSGGRLTAVCVRIGWCQRGENRPETIVAAGVTPQDGRPAVPGGKAGGDERDLTWFRNMWLSDRDYAVLMERALVASPESWPAAGIVVNGMSANRDMAWDLDDTRRLLGYEPEDDIWAHLG